MTCKFCNRKAIGGPCRWPVRIFVPTAYAELKEGDTVRRIGKALEHRPVAIVTEILYKDSGYDKLRVTIEIQSRTPRVKQFYVKPTSLARVEIPTYCNADTCEHHRRELAPKKLVCADHWRAWEQIA